VRHIYFNKSILSQASDTFEVSDAWCVEGYKFRAYILDNASIQKSVLKTIKDSNTNKLIPIFVVQFKKSSNFS
jgi:hypothetical protein